MAKMDKSKFASALGLPAYDAEEAEGPVDPKEEETESPQEQACEDIIDCLGVDPKSVDQEGLMTALEAFVRSVVAEKE